MKKESRGHRVLLANVLAPLVLAGLIATVGCGHRAPQDGAPSVIRLLPETSRGPLRPATFGDRVDVFAGVREWVPVGPAGSWQEENGSLIVESGGEVFDLERRVGLEASSLHVLEVTLASGYKVDLSLSWRRETDIGWGDPRLKLGYNEGRGEPHHKTFTFDLSTHREWSGTVTGLRLRLEPAREEERIVVRRLLGTRQSLPTKRLAELVLFSWATELDREVREALVVAPGHPLERKLQVPENGTLEFGLGATGRLESPLGVRVTAVRKGREREVLFESSLEPVEWAGARRWRQASIDLASLGGEDVWLRFESLAGPDFDPAFGLPVLAHPEIVQASLQPTQPNIILLSIDTLRADHLSLYGYASPTSPHLDAWARRSAVAFNNAVAQAPWTLPSHSSLLSGLGPLRHGVNHPFRAAPESLTTIAERLQEAGYFTAGIAGGGWLNPRYGLAQGYDRYRYWLGPQRGDQELEAHSVIASEWLKELREPFFLFFHSYDVHDFNNPSRTVLPATESPLSDLVARYDLAVAHMDEQLGRFLEAFEASGLRGRTILALTSDHGEDLGEDQVYGHGSLRDQVLLVPLVVELPDGRRAGSKIDAQVRSVDVMPTLLDAAGLALPPDLDGVSLLGIIKGESAAVPAIASSYFSLQHGISLRARNRWKYTYDSSVWEADDRREALYELPGGENLERDNLAPDHPLTAGFRAVAHRLLEQRLGGLRMRFENATSVPLVGTLRGDLIRVGSPKSLDLSGAWLSRTGDDSARFSLPPGEQFDLLFERIGDPRFDVLAPSAASSDGVLVVDFETATLPSTVRWTGSRWELENGIVPLIGAAGIVLEQHHGGAIEDSAPLELDPQLRSQLEALGYLD